MSISSTVKVFADHLVVEASGEYASGSYLELGDVVARASEQHQLDKVLLDLRLMSGVIANMDRFAAGVHAAQVWERSLRTAIVLPPEAIQKFFESTAYNSGVRTLVVSTLEEGKAWLGV